MKWEKANNHLLLNVQEFHLVDDGTTIAVLKYSTSHHSVRINAGSRHHRLFYIEKTKQPFSKALFKDQYGMTAGSILQDKIQDNSGSFVFDGRKFFYKTAVNNGKKLVIYESNPLKPLYSCSIPDNADASTIYFLVPAFYWCCQLFAADKKEVGHAA